MNKNLIVTLCVGELFEKIGAISHPTFKAYADKIGADFLVVEIAGDHDFIGYQKLDIFRDHFDTYERIAFIDTDILIRFDAPNIFDLVPETHIGAFNEGQIFPRIDAKRHWGASTGLLVAEFENSPVYFNTGVLVASKCHRLMFAPAPIEVDNFAEQTFLNFRLQTHSVPMFHLPYKFNRIHEIYKYTGEDFADGYFVHFAGAFNSPIYADRNLTEFAMMAIRFQDWKTAGEVPYLPKKIYVEMGGGLGDQVASEPLIRYMAEKLYPKDTMVVRTHHPEIIDHIPGITILPDGQKMPDTGFYHMNLMPPGPSEFSFNLCHPLDYVSLKTIKGQLIGLDRCIKLESYARLSLDVSKAVLVHPGKGWPSKTFPAEWWASVIRGICQLGITPVVIGSDTVDLDIPHAAIDLRGTLPLKELFQLIASAPVLISNDSSPVHIAGAFKNFVILIATCKQPEHVVPYRYGDLNKVLGKVIPRALCPNQLSEGRMDYCTPEELAEALPSPFAVVEQVKRIMREDTDEW